MEQKLLNTLTACSLFNGLNCDDISSALYGVSYRMVDYYRYDPYCLKGDTCRHADIVISGSMTVRMTGTSGQQVTVTSINPGDIIAPCYLFASDRHLPVTIEATSYTRVMRLSPESLWHIMESNPTICRNFIRAISDIGSFLASRIAFLSLLTVREKVAYYLRSEAAAQHSNVIRLNESRKIIADSFGIHKYSLLRSLAEFVKEGVIKVNGRDIVILAINRLK